MDSKKAADGPADGRLADAIAGYIAQAESLEEVRANLTERLDIAMRKEIITQVERLLPDNYSICRQRSIVSMVGDGDGSVPAGFYLDLRLMYGGKPVQPGSMAERKWRDIQRRIAPQLEDIAETYNVEAIILVAGSDL